MATLVGTASGRRALRALTADDIRSQGGPSWLVTARLEARERFAAAPLPSQSEEIWRYSRIDDLDLDAYEVAPTPSAQGGPALGPSVTDSLTRRSGTVELVDGHIVSIDLDPTAASAGLRVSALSALDARPDGYGSLASTSDPFVELSAALAPDGLFVETRRGAVIEAPLVIRQRLSAGKRAVASRALVRAGEVSELRIVEEMTGDDDASLFLPTLELDLGSSAHLSYVAVQALGRSTWQLAQQASRLERDATLVSLSVALGGDYARVRTDSRLNGAGASSRLLALYFGDGAQMHDFRTLQDHTGAKTTSDLLFKGAVQDTAQGVYSGLIRVAKGAAGTNAFQTNRNLVLSEGAAAWSVPNLEIEENDVRCSHASAVGPVDAEQLYYLESRGVPPGVAERLIVLGFFEDLLAGAPEPELHRPLREMVAQRLRGSVPSSGTAGGDVS